MDPGLNGGDVFIADAARTPVAPAHGALASHHPVDLLAIVIEAMVERSAIDPASPPPVFAACVERVGALAGNVANAALTRCGWVGPAAVMIDNGELSGHAALDAAIDAIAAGRASAALVLGIAHESKVPPGATLCGRDYGRPWADLAGPDDGPHACEQLAAAASIDTDQQVAWAAAMRKRRTEDERRGPSLVDVPASSGSSEPTLFDDVASSRDEPVGREPGVFASDGSITATTWVCGGDVAIAMMLTSVPGPGQTRIVARDQCVGFECDPRLTDRVADVAIDAQAAVIELHLIDRLGLDPEIVNRDGGALARGRPQGVSDLVAIADLHRECLRSRASAAAVSASTSGACRALRIEPTAPQ